MNDSLNYDPYYVPFGGYSVLNLNAGSDGVVRIMASYECLYASMGCFCTPQNCSDHFWTNKTVIGDDSSDEAYFTLEAYNVKPAKLQQIALFLTIVF